MKSPKFADSIESLRIERWIPAPPERVFKAWTDPVQLVKWWGPKGVRCLSAEIDLQVGGQYRIENELPDGNVLWISGVYEAIERPERLRYTWIVETARPVAELVTVHFTKHDRGTNIAIAHERIPTKALRDQHEQGWFGCMNGLVNFLKKFPA